MLSFIIPAHNEVRYLDATLTAIRAAAAAAGRPFELIVVDDASTDATATIARAHGATVVSVNLRHIAAARNAGAHAALGDVLIFVDADTCYPRQRLPRRSTLRAGRRRWGARVQMETTPALGPSHLGIVSLMNWLRLAAGCFMFARRDAFEAVGGYDERLFCGKRSSCRALRAQGAFVIVRPTVITSARKFEHVSLWDVIKLMVPMMTWSG